MHRNTYQVYFYLHVDQNSGYGEVSDRAMILWYFDLHLGKSTWQRHRLCGALVTVTTWCLHATLQWAFEVLLECRHGIVQLPPRCSEH